MTTNGIEKAEILLCCKNGENLLWFFNIRKKDIYTEYFIAYLFNFC